MKLGISLDDELVKRIDNYADKNYMSRSGLITLACTQLLNANEMSLAIKDMALAMRKIADTGNVSEEDLAELKKFEVLADLMSQGK